MIDLSITRDPYWIEQREQLWADQEREFKKHLRPNRLSIIKDYFMSASLPKDADLGDATKFYWFPIQNTQAWNYLFEHVVKDPKVFEEIFYFQFGDLSDRALNPEQELEMWDYFAGNTYQPIVTSRVPIGATLISFNVEPARVITMLGTYLKGTKGDQQSEKPKWMQRINYFLTAFPYVGDDEFRRRNKYADFETDTGNVVAYLFRFLIKPEFKKAVAFTAEQTERRLNYLQEFREIIEGVVMQPAMKQLWEETKQKCGTK